MLSLDEFQRLYDGVKPACEYWYGEAVQKSGGTTAHGLVQRLIMTALAESGWSPAPEVRLKVRPDAEPVPDVIAVRGKLKGRYPTSAPELCIEILSPEDRLSTTVEKARKYISWGTHSVWIIDPETRTAWMLSQGYPDAISIPPEGALEIGETRIELTTLFTEMDTCLDPAEDED